MQAARGLLKVATWNVNSLQTRLPHVLKWLGSAAAADILALQETKTEDAKFSTGEIEQAGYHPVFCGQKALNGVAILARSRPEDVVTDAGLPQPPNGKEEKRVIAATVGGVRIINLYVVNGSEVGSQKYQYKLAWLEALCGFIEHELGRHRDCIVLGDFNIAPSDGDVHDPEQWRGRLLCSDAERAALKRLLALGLVDTFRLFEQTATRFSWWDYRAGSFEKDRGLRIDLLLASAPLAERCCAAAIDRTPRTWERPSDHTPVTATFLTA